MRLHAFQLVEKNRCSKEVLKYPAKRYSGKGIVELVYDKHHVWIREERMKRKSIQDEKKCDLCGNIFEKRQFEYHKKKCIIAESRRLDNLFAKEMDYPIAEYGVAEYGNMDQETRDIQKMVGKELFQLKNSVYLTGPGGNGKSHLIKYLCMNYSGHRIWVCTPTGITSCRAEGFTNGAAHWRQVHCWGLWTRRTMKICHNSSMRRPLQWFQPARK